MEGCDARDDEPRGEDTPPISDVRDGLDPIEPSIDRRDALFARIYVRTVRAWREWLSPGETRRDD
jgi:hypothetical protein